jgi:hypothetical protein
MVPRLRFAGILSLALLVLSGAVASGQTSGEYRTPDELFADVARMVPEFGGMYVDPQQDALVVFATSQPEGFVDRIRDALRQVFPPEDLVVLPLEHIVVSQARYGWLQLFDWYRTFNAEVTTIDSLSSRNISEGQNRLEFGLQDISEKSEVESELDRLGIPREAVLVKQVGATLINVDDSSPSLLRWGLVGLAGAMLFALLVGWSARRRRRDDRGTIASERPAKVREDDATLHVTRL